MSEWQQPKPRGRRRGRRAPSEAQLAAARLAGPLSAAPVSAESAFARVAELRRTVRRSSYYCEALLPAVLEAHARAAAAAAAAAGSTASSARPPPNLVVLGLGRVTADGTAALQLAVALELRDALAAALALPRVPCEASDPVFEAADAALLRRCGCAPRAAVDLGKRRLRAADGGVTVLYMPHCPMRLYCNLLWANWASADLARLVVVGNDFREYVTSLARGAERRADPTNGVVRCAPFASVTGEYARAHAKAEPDLERAFANTAVHAFETWGRGAARAALVEAARPPEFSGQDAELFAAPSGDGEAPGGEEAADGAVWAKAGGGAGGSGEGGAGEAWNEPAAPRPRPAWLCSPVVCRLDALVPGWRVPNPL